MTPRKTEDLLKFIPQPEPEKPKLSLGLYEQLKNSGNRVTYERLNLNMLKEVMYDLLYKKEDDKNGQIKEQNNEGDQLPH